MTYSTTIAFFLRRGLNYTDADITACLNPYAVIGDPDMRDRFRQINPVVTLLLYRDVRITRATDMAWDDYEQCRQWIVRDADGAPITDLKYPAHFLLDMTNPVCQNHIAYVVSQGIRDYPGVYLDEASVYHYSQRYSAPLPKAVYDGWRTGMTETVRKLRALSPGKMIVGNVGKLERTLSVCRYMDFVHDESTMGTLYNCE